MIAGTILELLSCLSYVILFQGVFWRGPRALTARIAWSELGANSLVSMGGAGGIALGAWVLRLKGAPVERIAERSVALFALTSVVNVVALVVCGVGMGVGILDGPHDALLTFLPAGVGATAIVATLILARGARHLGRSQRHVRPRMARALGALSAGVASTTLAIRRPSWRVLGAVGYWAFDNAVLWVCLHAFGHAVPGGAVVMAYLVGMLANEVPLPGGIGAVESGLVGMLVLYGVQAGPAVAAVLVFRTISLWIPGVLGALAFVRLRRHIDDPVILGAQAAASPVGATER